jgi:leucyl aminopeptidase
MPIDEDYHKILECSYADCKSDDSQAMGGGSVGAAFL